MSDLSLYPGLPTFLQVPPEDTEEQDDAVAVPLPWKATRAHVIVRRVTRKMSKSGRLYVPDAHNEEMNVALVHEVGPDITDARIVRGSAVLIGEWGGTKVTVDGKAYFVLEEDEVLAVFEEAT